MGNASESWLELPLELAKETLSDREWVSESALT
jgi:hypothetical protein